jgi:hypothetical protein
MIMFHNSSIYDERLIYTKCNVFSHVLDTIGFPMKRKLMRFKFCFGVYAFQDPPLCNSTM